MRLKMKNIQSGGLTAQTWTVFLFLANGYHRAQETIKSKHHSYSNETQNTALFSTKTSKKCIFHLCINLRMHSVSLSSQMLRG